MSKFCGNCGTELADDAMFCGNCGNTMATQPAEAPATPVAPVAEAPAAPAAPVTAAVEAVKKNKNKIVKMLIPAVAVVLALAIVICAFAIPRGDEDNYFMSYSKEVRYDEDGDVIGTYEIKYDKPNRVSYYLNQYEGTTEIYDEDTDSYKEIDYTYKKEITIDYKSNKISSISVVEEDSRPDSNPLSFELNFDYSGGHASDSYTVTREEYDSENSYWDDEKYEFVEVYKTVETTYTIDITYDGKDVTLVLTSDEEDSGSTTLKIEEKGKKKTVETKWVEEKTLEDSDGYPIYDDEGNPKTEKVDHIRVDVRTYDKYGNQLTAETKEDDDVTYTYTAEYDGKNLISSESERTREEYDYETGKTKTITETVKVECEYDKKDNLISRKEKTDGDTTYEYEAEYDGELILREEYVHYYGDGDKSKSEVEYEYDKKGRMINQTHYYNDEKSSVVEFDESDGNEYTYKVYRYDGGDQVKDGKYVVKYKGDKPVATTVYDADGEIMEEMTFNKRGQMLTEVEYDYEDDANGKPEVYKSSETTYEYKYASAKNRAIVDLAEWIVDD